MLRYYIFLVRNLFRIPIIVRKMRKLIAAEVYSEEECYEYMQYIIRLMKKTGYIRTEVYGAENLPKEGGYVMYPNHQGKYDAYGIAGGHENPCTIVMDIAKSHTVFVREIIDMLRGKRLNKQDVRQALGVINEMAEEVKQGRRYIIFPEGEYDNQKKNTLIDFKAGCFKVSTKTKTPIVPVTLIDSYMAWNSSVFGTVTTQVHFLNPIYYEEYKGLNTQQIAAMVRDKIQQKIDEVTETCGIKR